MIAIGAAVAGCGSTASTGAEPTSPIPENEATAPAVSSTEVIGHSGGHAPDDGERPTIVEFGGAERERLAAQLVEAREVALALPTVADALAAGYELTTPYAPGTGAHLGKDEATHPPGAPLDVRMPQSLLYDGVEPDSRVVGLMYVQLGGDEPPDGFAGPLDTWAAFPGQCLEPGTSDPVFPTADSVTEDRCVEAGGQFLDITAWIQHVWVVPGWEAPGGVFAPLNDDIVCADGSRETGPTDGCPAP